MPSTLGRLGFTGKTVPPNWLLIRFRSTVRPTLPGASVAPITATARGKKKGLSGRDGLRRKCVDSRTRFVVTAVPMLSLLALVSSKRQLQLLDPVYLGLAAPQPSIRLHVNVPLDSTEREPVVPHNAVLGNARQS